ncbi:NO-inducible flavohemoprotein [Alkalibacillus almallahensis]|uniref:NO-inducible flavohemoprotein n=1 Tax=Alkalibacillus almallahensis TaxID=1379154 RepID=UPI001420A8E0|nr:NO-inducible flavohemoprotein [Alkalibacillus almallahensis]NIK12005.1 nitric oxide dioxygenase [Alkalibacillus almallahensis]
MLTEQQKDTIKATAPVLREHGTTITTRFYQLLFEKHPELLNIFNQANQKQGKQQRALANSIIASAEHIDQLESIMPVVEQIAHKHRSLGIKPEHYPIVGENLLIAIKDVLGDAATDDIMQAWEDAYQVIADIFISVEADLYEATEQQPGGWKDFKPFYISDKVVESDVITSFYLKPVDEQPLPTFKSGQYISVKLDIPSETYTNIRQYSLSYKPNQDYFRISVKREDEHDPNGVVSNYLHNEASIGDQVDVSAPAGEFTLDTNSTKPLVLMAGGVGITPLINMLHTVVEQQPNRPVSFVHAVRNGNVQAFELELTDLVLDHQHVNLYTILSHPTADDEANKHYHHKDFITYDWMKDHLPMDEADFYFCGPKPFMEAVMNHLSQHGVTEDRLNFEFFGPQEELETVQ